MEDSVQVPIKKTLSDSDITSPRQAWVEKHAELIAKLEAEYQQPQQTESAENELRFYTFSIEDINILIPNEIPSEVFERSMIHSLPLAPEWLLGACNIRGDIVPIIDFCKIIGVKSKDINFNECTTLVLDKGDQSLGFVLDKLPTVILFKNKEKVSAYSKLPEVFKSFIKGAYKRKNKLYVHIDFPSLIKSFAN